MMKKKDEDDLYKWYQRLKARDLPNCNTNWVKVIQETWLPSNDENEKSRIEDLSADAFKVSVLEGDKSISVRKCNTKNINTTKQIAVSLGIEQDESSVSRLSTILTPYCSRHTKETVLKTPQELTVKNLLPSEKNKSYPGNCSKSHMSPVSATKSSEHSFLTGTMSFADRSSTQGFNTVGIKNFHETCKESRCLATPEAVKCFQKTSSGNSLPCTSTPLSHCKMNSEEIKHNKCYLQNENCIHFNSPILKSEHGHIDQRSSSESFENLPVNCLSENLKKNSEFQNNLLKNTIETSKNVFSRLSLKRKKKFIYPAIEEEVSEELALKSAILHNNVNSLGSYTDEIENKLKVNIKQKGFKSASDLKENIIEPIINIQNSSPRSEESRRQENFCGFNLLSHENLIACDKENIFSEEIKCCDNLSSKMNTLEKDSKVMNDLAIPVSSALALNEPADDKSVLKIVPDDDEKLVSVETEYVKLKESKLSEKSNSSEVASVLELDEKRALPTFPGFQSAAGKKVNICSKSLLKAKALLDDEGYHENEMDEKHCKFDKLQDNFTFLSDNGKNNETSLKNNSSPEQLPKNAEYNEGQELTKSNFSGFKYSAENKINSGSEALKKGKVSIDDARNDETEINQNIKLCGSPSSKIIQISDISLPSTSHFQKDATISPCSSIRSKKVGLTNFGFPGFQSAAGKKINVSEEALQRAKAILEEDDDTDDKAATHDLKRECLLNASNDAHNVRKRMDNIDSVHRSISKEKETSLENAFPGFMSAAGKKISISTEALLRAKAIWDDESDELSTDITKQNTNFTNECGSISPVLGSQRNKRVSQKRSIQDEDGVNSLQKTTKILKTDFEESAAGVSFKKDGDSILDSEENREINEITEAFLLDLSEDDVLMSENCDKELSVQAQREELTKKKQEIIKMKTESKNLSENNSKGVLFQYKLSHQRQRVKLSDLRLSEIFLTDDVSALHITSKNCCDFRFEVQSSSLTLHFEDNLEIVPGADGRIGWKEIEMGLLCDQDIKTSILPSMWLKNHYSLIIWKLASLQRRLGDNFQNRVFTLDEVVRQIRFRYDLEILEGKRSVLRKIYEQDDTPRKTMVLCVFYIDKKESSESEISSENESSYRYSLTLTDGWYFIDAQIDGAMVSLISKKIINIGTKLLIHGAEIIGNPGPCHPLQVIRNGISLKLHTNMCRLSTWHSKLGLSKHIGLPSPTNLSAILDDGGVVGSITAILCRRYPITFYEKNNNKTVFVNEKVYDIKKRASEIEQESIMQKLYYEVEKEFEKDERKCNKGISRSLENLEDGQEICEFIEQAHDPSIIQSLTEEQIQLVQVSREEASIKRKQRINLEVKLRAKKLLEAYQAVSILKLGVCDKSGKEAVITVWRPQEQHLNLEEGKTYSFHYLSSSSTRFNVKQLTWIRHSFIRTPEASLLSFKCRHSVSKYSDITSSYLDETPFQEIDIVGVVIKIIEVKGEAQDVYLSDIDYNFIVLRFSPSISDLQYQDIIRKGRVISAVNCNWRRQQFNGFYVLNITPFSHISSHIPYKQNEDSLMKLVNEIKENSSFVSNAESRLGELCVDIGQQTYNESDPDGKTFSSNINKLKISSHSLSVLSRPFRTPVRSVKN